MLSSLLLMSVVAAPAAPFTEDKPAPKAWSHGAPALQSIGELAFSEAGVLFMADPIGGSVHAIKTDVKPTAPGEGFLIEGPRAKIGALLGTTAAGININDIIVHPKNGDVYLSVTRGSGKGSQPALVNVDSLGEFSLVPLKDVDYMSKKLGGAKNSDRSPSISDLVFFDGRLYVAGISNEEFASNLRSLAFPFDEKQELTAVEIYHGAHGAYETRAPIRTFMPYEIEGESHLVAAYTCTPLVTFSVTDLKPGTKVRGKTVAELGSGNRPLDMVGYEKDGERFILMSNSRYGVIKIPTKDMGKAEHISTPVRGKKGMGYESIEDLEGVLQMAPAGNNMLAVLLREPDSSDLMLATVELP
jgi:hypothetical protein